MVKWKGFDPRATVFESTCWTKAALKSVGVCVGLAPKITSPAGSSMPVHKPMPWLRFAIQVYEQTKSPFLIVVGNSLSDTTLNNSNDIWMVDAPSPAENEYSAAVGAYLGPFSVERHPHLGPATRHGRPI